MKRVALSEVKDDLSKYLRLASREEVLITRNGKPAKGVISRSCAITYRATVTMRFTGKLRQKGAGR